MNKLPGHDRPTGRLLQLLVVAAYVACLFLIAAFAYRRPHYNWDMLAYMALVVQKDHSDPAIIHQVTYQHARNDIPATEYGYLLGGDRRKLRSEDPKVFYDLLPFYAVKPLYIEMVNLFYKAGFSLPIATVLPSILSYLLIGALLLYWLSRHLSLYWAAAVSGLLMLAGFMVFAARLSTPDALSAFLLLSAFYFILERPSPLWMFVFFFLALLTRLDNIIPALFIISLLFFSGKWARRISLKQYLLMAGILVIGYFGITAMSMRPFGWDIWYYPTFARHLDLAGTFHASFSVKAYLAVLYSQAITALVHTNFALFLLLFVFILYSPSFKWKTLSFEQLFCITIILAICFRFLLFPDLADRFHVAYYLCFVLILVKRAILGFKGLKV